MTESSKFNFYLLRSAIVAALGGLLFGFDTAVIAGVTRALSDQYHLTPALLGFTVSSALWGTVLGSIFAAAPSDKYGRKACLKGLAVLYVVTALGCALAWDWWSFLFFRTLGGLAIGGSSVIAPMYIAEIAPAERRGRLVAMFQFNVVLGILVAYLSNYVVGLAATGPHEWRWKLGIAALPAMVFLLTLFNIPQSPRWLVQKGRIEEARAILLRIGERNADQEIDEISRDVGQKKTGEEPLFQKKYSKPIFLAISIGMFNQLSGINAILYYLNDIFERAGFEAMSANLQAVAIGATNLLFTMIAVTVIDKLGRRKLLLTGAAGTAACLAGVAAIFATGQAEHLLLWLLIGFIAFFAFSQGAVIWVYLSEVFPTAVRAKGQSLGSFTHWFMNAVISAIYPVLAASTGASPFVFFSAMTIVQFFVVLSFYPETRGLTLEELHRRNFPEDRLYPTNTKTS